MISSFCSINFVTSTSFVSILYILQTRAAADLHSLHALINRNISKIVKSLYLYGHKNDIPKLVVAIVNLGDPNSTTFSMV